MPATNPKARLYHNARREAVFIVLVWGVTMLWVVGYSYLRGYIHPADSWLVTAGLARSPAELEASVWGFPTWVLYGILLPWLLASAATVLIARFVIADDDLGSEEGDGV
jgi:hypothetical protein